MRAPILFVTAMILALTKPVFAEPGASGNGAIAAALLAQIDPDKPVDSKDAPPPGEIPPDTTTAPPVEPPVGDAGTASSFWTHNGSVMALQANGDSRVFTYQEPRQGIANQGATQGTILFRGRADGSLYSGTAFIFSNRCGPREFPATGEATPDFRRVVLHGRAPLLGPLCGVRGLKEVTLVFDFLSKTR